MTPQKTLPDLIAEYAKVKAERMSFEKKAAELKRDMEEPLKQLILMEMASSGVKSVNIDGIGSVAAKTSDHYEITDMEKLAYFMLQQMVKCAQEGRPLSDGVLLQARVSRAVIEEYLGDSINMAEADDAALAPFGVKLVSKPDLSVTRR